MASRSGPNYGKPAAPVAEDWIQADDSSVQRQHVQEWWRVFGDPALDSLIVTAYEQNPTLRIAGTGCLRPGPARRSPWPTCSPKHSRRPRRTAGSILTPTCP